MQRREFLKQAGLGGGMFMLPHTQLSFLTKNSTQKREVLNFGIVADVHHGMLPDAEERLEVFIQKSIEKEVDFIIQLGDFCHKTKNQAFLDIWNTFQPPKYHVLGNHDMDLGSKAEIMDKWEMPQSHYTFEAKGVRFLILDANFLYQDGKFIDYNKANFYVDSTLRTYINEEQIEWFAGELEASDLPTIVISHQSLWHYQWGVKNRLAVQRHMEKHAKKIICCLNGHNHIDFHHQQNGIDYLEINSMSYQWMGDKQQVKRYPQELLKEYKWLNHIAPYEDPLYAFARVDLTGSFHLEGVRSTWMAPSPEEAGSPKPILGNQYSPIISNYHLAPKNP